MSTPAAKTVRDIEEEFGLLRAQLEGGGTSFEAACMRVALPLFIWLGVVVMRPAARRWLERRYGVESDSDDRAGDLRKQVMYRLDLWFSTNPYSKIEALAYITLGLVIAGAVAIFAVSDTTAVDAVWESLEGTGIDWNFARAAERLEPTSLRGLMTRVVAVSVSLGGMFVTAILLGIVSDTITYKFDELRKGKSDVLESGHTVILGWSDKIFGVLQQLCLANESEGGGVIVLMSEVPKQDQEDALRKKALDTLGTVIICRQGSPLVGKDLERVSANKARSVVVLSDDTLRPDQADARSLRVALSFVSEIQEHHEAEDRCIVMEMQDVDNEPLVQLVGGEHVETIVTHDLIGRLMIQSARHPGLARVWADLLGFDGCEFYCAHHPDLVGCTFGDALLRFDDAVPIGVVRRDRSNRKSGHIYVNPDDDLVIDEDTEIIVIAEDDDSYEVRPADDEGATSPAGSNPSDGKLRAYFTQLEGQKPGRATTHGTSIEHGPECVAFCGWRRDMDDIVQVLDDFVYPGSELHIFCEVPVAEQERRLLEQREIRKKPRDLANLRVYHSEGLLCSRRDLEEKLPIARMSSIVILADESEELDATSKDSQALTTLLLIREIQSKTPPQSEVSRWVVPPSGPDTPSPANTTPPGSPDRFERALEPAKSRVGAISWAPGTESKPEKLARQSSSPKALREKSPTWSVLRAQRERCQIISEILDNRTSRLISNAQISDYVLSNDLVSMALAMIAEDRTVNNLLKILMESEGSEFYIRRAADLVDLSAKRSFYDVMRAGRVCPRGAELVIGYRRRGEEPVLNPPNKHEKVRWSKSCCFIVLAED